MTDHSGSAAFVRAFCEALASRDPSKLRPMLADDVEWTIFGPIDYFPFFGTRRGQGRGDRSDVSPDRRLSAPRSAANQNACCVDGDKRRVAGAR